MSRGGHGLHGPFLRIKAAQNGPLRPDPPLAKPACRRSIPGAALGTDPDCQRCALSSVPSGRRQGSLVAGFAFGLPSARRYARLKCRPALPAGLATFRGRHLSLATALAVGVFDADTCGRRILLDLSGGPRRAERLRRRILADSWSRLIGG